VIERVRTLGHPLCVGIDPHLALVPDLFGGGAMSPADPATAAGVERLCLAFVDLLEGRTAIVKPQIAFFEQLGWRGVQALERVVARCHERGLLVLLDAKRGDIGSTAAGYARAYLASDSPIPADALTVNPYMGFDTLEPFAKQASASGRGLFVLVKTSNPGSGDLQDQLLAGDDDLVFERVARGLGDLAGRMSGPVTGWSSLGVVVGATYPEHADRVRALLPRSLFLVPGYGSQGGSAADAVRGFVSGPAGLEGGLVNSSRGILFAEGTAEAGSAKVWEEAITHALDRAADELGQAVASG
jgi:orotidine-5'-phosphate decarboxylase